MARLQSSGTTGKRGTARTTPALLRELPAVGKVVGHASFRRVARAVGADLATDLLREVLAEIRAGVLSGTTGEAELRSRTAPAALASSVADRAERLLAPSPRGVINATGVVVHTNLGRSLLSEQAAARVAEAASFYMDLEYDLARGERGSRSAHLEPLLDRLFPGHASFVVNNNAAAILLALRALARGREAIVSRGELVEIGGSFRMPDIFAASGVKLNEVGTTNRTRLKDYELACSTRTGLILKVHTSNFRLVGFAEDTSVQELSGLARRLEVPLVVDWGSGDLLDLVPLGIGDEKPVRRILDEGADLVTFSGDKLLGGPQAGIVVGRRDLVDRMKRDPMARVVRLDRLMICALRETLAAYVRGSAFDEVPTLRMLALSPEAIGRRAGAVKRALAPNRGIRAKLSVEPGVSKTGGGSSPGGERPTRLLVVEREGHDAGGWERALREGTPPVVARVHEGKLLLDLRTVLPGQDGILAKRLEEVLAERDAPPRRRQVAKRK